MTPRRSREAGRRHSKEGKGREKDWVAGGRVDWVRKARKEENATKGRKGKEMCFFLQDTKENMIKPPRYELSEAILWNLALCSVVTH